jgi:indolepyruvate ferredoxin oxidoreductase beta subunit
MSVFNLLFTGVGGEGALLASAIAARAASYDGYEVAGIQLHGLAQRGGVIPTHVRFGKEVHSPTIPHGEADLIIALETIEAARVCQFANKERTRFLIDTYPIRPVYANLFGERYPSVREIEEMLMPFAKSVLPVDASGICRKELGSSLYGNTMILGIALSRKLLPITKASMLRAIECTIPRDLENNLRAFEMGLKY